METLALLAIGAWVLSRLNKGQDAQAQAQAQAQAAAIPTGPVMVPFPFTADGKLVQVTLPWIAPLWKDVPCNDTGAAIYAQDLLSKRQRYQEAYDAWVMAGRPTLKSKKVRKELIQAEDSYKKSVQFFFYKCKP